jgi:hypothetical protein
VLNRRSKQRCPRYSVSTSPGDQKGEWVGGFQRRSVRAGSPCQQEHVQRASPGQFSPAAVTERDGDGSFFEAAEPYSAMTEYRTSRRPVVHRHAD